MLNASIQDMTIAFGSPFLLEKDLFTYYVWDIIFENDIEFSIRGAQSFSGVIDQNNLIALRIHYLDERVPRWVDNMIFHQWPAGFEEIRREADV